jgi:aconitate hydratase
MGAELGATSSLFPSDERTRAFLEAQGRGSIWRPLAADPDSTYDESLKINLSQLEPLLAKPHSPDNVLKVREIEGTPVNQVCVGSCTNSSYEDLMVVAAILKGKTVHPNLSVTITPGTKQVFTMIARNGALADLIAAGARILEAACGPCMGMGRNFKGRCGTPDAQVYLASPETCAATALYGVITDPRKLGDPIVIETPSCYAVDDNMILPPAEDPDSVEVISGPNIKPVPVAKPVPDVLRGRLLIKVGDNITTDHILPAGAHIMPLRSNIPAISEYMFGQVDPAFVKRAKEWGGGFVAGGVNYGQGSSREHAALAPLYLGVKAVFAKSFARIHYANLVNAGILPLTFVNEADYVALEQGDELEIVGILAALQRGGELTVRNLTRNKTFQLIYYLTKRQVSILQAGGLLNYVKLGGQ